MKNHKAAIIHGTGGHPERNWFPWLKEELVNRNIETIVPKFPTPEGQSLTSWRETFLNEVGPISPDLILFGHSIGAAFVLNLLHRSDTPAKAVFLVAGFLGKLDKPEFDTLNESFFAEEFDWEKIRNNAKKIFIYAGDNDPYVPLEKGSELAKCLKAELVIIPNGGHLNQDSGFKEFPRLIEDLELMLKGVNDL